MKFYTKLRLFFCLSTENSEEPAKMTTTIPKVYVGHIPTGISERAVDRFFSKYGRIVRYIYSLILFLSWPLSSFGTLARLPDDLKIRDASLFLTSRDTVCNDISLGSRLNFVNYNYSCRQCQ